VVRHPRHGIGIGYPTHQRVSAGIELMSGA
jgi:hypothetical protein